MSFPVTNPSFGHGYPLPHWELRVDNPGDVLRDAPFSDIDERHARVTQAIETWMNDVAGPNLKHGAGAARATHIATQKMMELGTERYQADELLVKHSEMAWREYICNVMATDGKYINELSAIARQRVRSAAQKEKLGIRPIMPSDP